MLQKAVAEIIDTNVVQEILELCQEISDGHPVSLIKNKEYMSA